MVGLAVMCVTVYMHACMCAASERPVTKVCRDTGDRVCPSVIARVLTVWDPSRASLADTFPALRAGPEHPSEVCFERSKPSRNKALLHIHGPDEPLTASGRGMVIVGHRFVSMIGKPPRDLPSGRNPGLIMVNHQHMHV